MDKKLVLKLGGSVLFENLNAKRLINYARVIAGVIKTHNIKLAIVIGGGKVAKKYCEIARELRADNVTIDEIGILLTHVNAELFRLALMQANINVPPRIAKTISEIIDQLQCFNIAISGGFFPGQSTSACAALIAEKIRADCLLFGTNVKGVYSGDPHKTKSARKIDKITVGELMKILLKESSAAGRYPLLDFVTLKILERAKIPALIFDATNPENVKRVIKGVLSKDEELILEVGSIIKSDVGAIT